VECFLTPGIMNAGTIVHDGNKLPKSEQHVIFREVVLTITTE